MSAVLVPGGTGLIGQALIPVLSGAGYQPVVLSRSELKITGNIPVHGYTAEALTGATAIINLAGENLSAGRWTADRKTKIINSRVNTLSTLYHLLESNPHTVKTLISASATGFYGTQTSDHVYQETDPPGNDFLAEVCFRWEEAARSFESLGIRVVTVRTGVVFSDQGGALPKLMLPLKFGVSLPLASGNQWIPWIWIDDLAGIFLHLLQNERLSGAFNAVAPEPVTNRQLMKQLARQHHRFFIPTGVPAFLLNMALGEMSVVILQGSRVSSEKIEQAGYVFTQPRIP